MKHFKVFSVMLAVLTAGVMTSCLNSSNGDDDEDVAQLLVQLKQEQTASKGRYNGYLYYATRNVTAPADSAAVTWRIDNDSTMVMEDVPVSCLTAQVSDSILRTQLAAAGTVDLKVKIYYYAAVSPLVFCVAPQEVYVPLVGDNGATQGQATLHFYTTAENTDSYGAYNMTSRESLLRLYLRDVYVGASVQQRFASEAVMAWFGKHL